MSRFVSRKCPRWLVAKWDSMPSGDKVRSGTFMIPALLIRMSIEGMSGQERTSAAAARTEACEARSMTRARCVTVGKACWSLVILSCNLENVRPLRIRALGPCEACRRGSQITIVSPPQRQDCEDAPMLRPSKIRCQLH